MTRFLQATKNGEMRAALAEYLNVPPASVEYLHGFAAISDVHSDLADPRMLNILADRGIETIDQLKTRVQGGTGSDFVKSLDQAAKRQGLTIGQIPPTWVQAIKALRT